MGRHIRGWYGLSDCHGSQPSWTETRPDDWDARSEDEQQEYLDEIAQDYLNSVLDCGAEVIVDGTQ
jgi:hypothetical protein